MPNPDELYCFFDTNILLHFTTFDEVNWPKFLEVAHVYLVLTRPVMRDLNRFSEEGQPPPGPRRQRRYGAEVQHALFPAWHAANRVCSKRLMPFLPTLIESLERHGHLQLSEACRSQLLSMSAATADRLLRAPRTQGLRGIATTRAGTLLKQQIPIRTYQQTAQESPGLPALIFTHILQNDRIEGTHWLVFDIDGTRQAARQRALPCTPDLPPAQRRLDKVCAPG